MQVGDALVRVHHGKVGADGEAGVQVGPDRLLLVLGQGGQFVVGIADTIVGIETQFFESVGVLVEGLSIVGAYAMSEDDGVRDFHHGGFQVQREQNAVGSGIDFLLQE